MLLRELENDEFIDDLNEKDFSIIDIYLEKIVPDQIDPLLSFSLIMNSLYKNPYALVLYASSMRQKGTIDLNLSNYEKCAIQAYQSALKIYTKDQFPMDFAMSQGNLGVAYCTLAGSKTKR